MNVMDRKLSDTEARGASHSASPNLPALPGLAASLSVEGVTVTYPNGNTAVRDAFFALGPGTICALVGVNGSGKATLFKSIMGFVAPQKGVIRIGGLPARDALKRNMVAYVPQSEEVDWNFPVLVDDVVEVGGVEVLADRIVVNQTA